MLNLARTPDLLNQNQHFNKIPRGFVCVFKFDKHCFKLLALKTGCTLETAGHFKKIVDVWVPPIEVQI